MKSLIKNRLRVAHGGRREPNWKENDEILNAAGVNDVNLLQQLSSRGVDVTAACNWNESTTLHVAAQRGSYRVVEMLLDFNAKLNVTNNAKSTPLHYASSGGHQEVVKLLIDAGALIRCKDKDNKTPLHLAANRGHCDVVKMLVAAGATVDAKDKHGNTPLVYAIKNNHRVIANYLINEAKADVSKISKDLQHSYKSPACDKQRCSYGQARQSVTSTPSHLSSNQHQQRYNQQQQMRQAHLMQRTQQYQTSASQQQRIDHNSTHKQQYHSVFLHMGKQMQQMSQSQQNLQQGQQPSRQSLHLELQIQIPPLKDSSQENKQDVQQTHVKKQHNVKPTLSSSTSQCDQGEKPKHGKTQLQRPKNGLAQERVTQKQKKLVEEAEELCTEEELLYTEDYSRLYEIEQEMNGSTSDLVSDITDCYGNTVAEKSDEIITDNDETCSEIDTVANDINTLVNAPKTQEITNGHQTSVYKERSSDTENSPTAVTSHHLLHQNSSQLLQPHPHCAAQQSTNDVKLRPVTMPNTTLQDQQPPLSNYPHQQPINYYPSYQPFYHQQSSTLPGHYLPSHELAHQQPIPNLPHRRHCTLPVISYHHPASFAHYHQQDFPCSSEHRSSSPAVLEHVMHAAVPQYNTMHYNLQPPIGHVTMTQSNLISSQHSSPTMSPSPSPVPLVVPAPSPVPSSSPVTAPSPVKSLSQQDVEQQHAADSNNLPTDDPQQIDIQLQELMRRIEALKLQREACRRTSKQDNSKVNSAAPDNLRQFERLESSSTNASDTSSTDSVPHTVINSATPDLPSDNTPSPNADLIPLQKPNTGNQLISNLFSNFQTPSQAVGGNVVVQMLVMQDNNIAFPSSTTLSIDYGEDNHNSLKSFTTDIYSAIDVDTILPFMVKHGLLSSSQHQYLLNPYHTSNDKQNKITCIAVTASEDCVEKFLLCLQETSYYEPHETLLKKIREGTEQMNEE